MGSPLTLKLERATVTTGDAVRGVVRVEQRVDPCEGLDVYLEYSGQRISAKRVGLKTLVAGPLSDGDAHQFEVTVPAEAPFTFTGPNHDLTWKVVARADVSWAIDPRAEQPLVVEPRQVSLRADEQAAAASVAPAPTTEMGLVGKVLVGAIVVVLCVCLAPLLPFLLIFIARQQVLNTRLKDFSVEVPEGHYLLGQWVPVKVTFLLKRAVEINELTVQLKGSESWSSGKSTRTEHFHTDETQALEYSVLAPAPREDQPDGPDMGIYRSPGKATTSRPELVLRTAVRLPPDGLPSVGDKVYYKIHAKLDVKGWPNASSEVKLKTVGATVQDATEPPPTDPPWETSPGLVFARQGTALPAGVEAPASGTGLWGWILLCLAGVSAMSFGAYFVYAAAPVLWSVGAWVVGLGLTGAGVHGFYRKIR